MERPPPSRALVSAGPGQASSLEPAEGSPAAPTPRLGSGPSLPAWVGNGTVASPSPLLSHL